MKRLLMSLHYVDPFYLIHITQPALAYYPYGTCYSGLTRGRSLQSSVRCRGRYGEPAAGASGLHRCGFDETRPGGRC